MSEMINHKTKELAENLIRLLSAKSLKCATAESCTGGAVGAALTSVAGSSAVYLGGVISYDNSVKINTLNVSQEVILTKGAVSEECALQMAEGVKKLLNADIAISVTGIAGPGGGSVEKPVGTVFFAIATKLRTRAFSAYFSGMRDDVRLKSVEFAISELLQEVAEMR